MDQAKEELVSELARGGVGCNVVPTKEQEEMCIPPSLTYMAGLVVLCRSSGGIGDCDNSGDHHRKDGKITTATPTPISISAMERKQFETLQIIYHQHMNKSETEIQTEGTKGTQGKMQMFHLSPRLLPTIEQQSIIHQDVRRKLKVLEQKANRMAEKLIQQQQQQQKRKQKQKKQLREKIAKQKQIKRESKAVLDDVASSTSDSNSLSANSSTSTCSSSEQEINDENDNGSSRCGDMIEEDRNKHDDSTYTDRKDESLENNNKNHGAWINVEKKKRKGPGPDPDPSSCPRDDRSQPIHDISDIDGISEEEEVHVQAKVRLIQEEERRQCEDSDTNKDGDKVVGMSTQFFSHVAASKKVSSHFSAPCKTMSLIQQNESDNPIHLPEPEPEPEPEFEPASRSETTFTTIAQFHEQISNLKEQLQQTKLQLHREREEHVQSIRRERELHDDQIQALQMRLYISDTKCKNYEDALRQHLIAVKGMGMNIDIGVTDVNVIVNGGCSGDDR